MKYCTNCGAKLEDEAKFCINCGMKIESTEVKPEESVETPIEEAPEVVTEEAPEEAPEEEVSASEVPGVPTLPTVESAVELVKNDFPVSAVVFAFIACLTVGIPGLIFSSLSKKKIKKYLKEGGQKTSLVKAVRIFATLAFILSILGTIFFVLIYVIYGIIFMQSINYSGSIPYIGV